MKSVSYHFQSSSFLLVGLSTPPGVISFAFRTSFDSVSNTGPLAVAF